MKAFFIFLLFSISILPQQMKIGGSLNFLTGNKYTTYQVGPTLIFDYSQKDFPLAFQGSVGFYLAELEAKHFSSGYTYSDFSIAVSINYFPIAWAIEPYVGIGTIYNVINLSSSGHIQFNNGLYRVPSIPKNNLSIELKGGIRFSANSPINFNVEVSQTFSKPVEIIYYNANLAEEGRENIFIFNSLFVRIGLLFQI